MQYLTVMRNYIKIYIIIHKFMHIYFVFVSKVHLGSLSNE